jgi:hypothetical protein
MSSNYLLLGFDAQEMWLDMLISYCMAKYTSLYL